MPQQKNLALSGKSQPPCLLPGIGLISDKGRLIATLFSVFNVADAKGEKYNEGELLRWLGEGVLYPTNLLPGEKLQWFPIDLNTAKLTFHYKSLSLFFRITFNEIGEITGMETKRYMGDKNLETWVIKTTNYKELNNVIIPTAFDVIWRLEKGDFSYAKFNVTEVEYGKPENSKELSQGLVPHEANLRLSINNLFESPNLLFIKPKNSFYF